MAEAAEPCDAAPTSAGGESPRAAPEAEGPADRRENRRPNYSWAQLMMRVFAIDVLECERCGGRLRILAAIHPPEATKKILDCLGLPSKPPPVRPAGADLPAAFE